MVTQSYHLSVSPDINKEKNSFLPPLFIELYISDATIQTQDEKATLSCLEGRIFHGLIVLLPTVDVLNLKFDSYSGFYLPNNKAIVYKVYNSHEEAFSNLVDGGRYYHRLSFRLYNAEELSSGLREILKQEILVNLTSYRDSLVIVQEEDLDVLSELIKTNFLDTRPPLP